MSETIWALAKPKFRRWFLASLARKEKIDLLRMAHRSVRSIPGTTVKKICRKFERAWPESSSLNDAIKFLE
jgi:hypothetical protein